MENEELTWLTVKEMFGYDQDVERPHVGDSEHIGCGVFIEKVEPVFVINGEVIWMGELS